MARSTAKTTTNKSTKKTVTEKPKNTQPKMSQKSTPDSSKRPGSASNTKKSAPKKDSAKKTSARSSVNYSQLKTQLEQEMQTILHGLSKHTQSDFISPHGDLVDQSTNFSEHENLLGLAEHDRNRLAEIKEAIEKIDQGTYGICSNCGEEIPQVRLSAIPTAKYCLNCQSKMEYFK